MGERAKIMLNEYTAKTLLKRDDLDLDKFYSTDIKMMVKVAQQELKKKDNIINELEKWLEDNLGNCRTNQNYTSNQIYNLKEDAYYRCLNRLKELKENNK